MTQADDRDDNPNTARDDRREARLAEAGTTPPSVDRRRASDHTDVHDPGSDANETADGLNESEEALRHAIEDVASGGSPDEPTETVPVFDRRSLPPKI